MNPKLEKVLDFFRIIDRSNKLSITNLAVYIVMFKIAVSQEFNLVDAGALLIALLNYSGKKVIDQMSQKKEDKVQEQMDLVRSDVESKVKELKEQLSEVKDKVGAVQASRGITKIL